VKQCKKKLETLKFLSAHQMDKQKTKQLIDILDEMAHCCDERTNQIVLFNINFHLEVIGIIRRPADLTADANSDRIPILTSCYNFLRAFVRKNREIQQVVYESLDFMLHQMEILEGYQSLACVIAATISEIFRDNEELCAKISEKDIGPFLSVMFEHKLFDPIFVEFFRIIIRPRAQILRGNQNAVLKKMISLPQTKTLLVTAKKAQAKKLEQPRNINFNSEGEEDDDDDYDSDDNDDDDNNDNGNDDKDYGTGVGLDVDDNNKNNNKKEKKRKKKIKTNFCERPRR